MKKELLVLLAAIGLLGFILHETLDAGRWWRPEEPAMSAAPAVALDRGSVQRLELRRPGDILVFRRAAGGGWEMSSPVVDKADQERVGVILDILKGASSAAGLRIPLAGNARDRDTALAAMGLDAPQTSVVYLARDAEQRLWIGKDAPESEGSYTRWGDSEEVLVMSMAIRNMLDMPARELRERRVFFDARKPIVGARLRNPQQEISLWENGRVQYVADGGARTVHHRADPKAREEILALLRQTRCLDFWDGANEVLMREEVLEIEPLRGYGMAEETWRIERVSTLSGKQWLCRNKGKTFVIAPGPFEKFFGDMAWVLDKRWSEGAEPGSFLYLSLDRGGPGVAFVQREQGWGWVQDNPRQLDVKKIEGFLQALLAMEAKRVEAWDEELSQGDAVRVRLGKGVGQTMELSLTPRGADWVLRREGDSAQFVVDAEALALGDLDESRWLDPAR